MKKYSTHLQPPHHCLVHICSRPAWISLDYVIGSAIHSLDQRFEGKELFGSHVEGLTFQNHVKSDLAAATSEIW